MQWVEEHIRKDVCRLNSKLNTTKIQIESSQTTLDGIMHQSIPGAKLPPGQPPGFCTYFQPGSRGFVPSELPGGCPGSPGGRTYCQSTKLSVDAA